MSSNKSTSKFENILSNMQFMVLYPQENGFDNKDIIKLMSGIIHLISSLKDSQDNLKDAQNDLKEILNLIMENSSDFNDFKYKYQEFCKVDMKKPNNVNKYLKNTLKLNENTK